MSGYRGRGARRGSGHNGGRYFDYEPSGERPPRNFQQTRGAHTSWRNNNNQKPRTENKADSSSKQSYKSTSFHNLRSQTSVVEKSDPNTSNFYCQNPPLFVQPPQIAQPVAPSIDCEMVKPGPNAVKKVPFTVSPVRRLPLDRSAPGTSQSSSLHDGAELAKRRAFDAKRIKTHSESEWDTDQVVTIEDLCDEPQPKHSDERVGGHCIKPGMEATAEMTRLHILSVENELSSVDAEITRLRAKREELVKQKANLTDIYSTMIGSDASSQISVVRSQTNQVRTPTPPFVKKTPGNLPQTGRIELQCPEVSTQAPLSPDLPDLEVFEEKVSKASVSPEKSSVIIKKTTPAVKRKPSISVDELQPAIQQPSSSFLNPPPSTQPSNVAVSPRIIQGSMTLAFRDVDSGKNSRGDDRESFLVSCLAMVHNDMDTLLIGYKSGQVSKYSLNSRRITRREQVFRKGVTALCGILFPESGEMKIFAGSTDGEYRCFNGNLSESISGKSFGWGGVCCIKYLLNHVYIGIGSGLVNIVCPKRGVVLERFSSGTSYVYDIEALQDSAVDTVVCSVKGSDSLDVRDVSGGLVQRNIKLPRLTNFSSEQSSSMSTPSTKQSNSASSSVSCTHLACTGSFIFGCQANGQIIAVTPGSLKATVVANLDSRPLCISVIGVNSTNGIYVAAITADGIVRVFLVSSSTPLGAIISKRKISSSAGSKKKQSFNAIVSSSSEDEEITNQNLRISVQQIFQASMATKDRYVGEAVITPSGLICLISYTAKPSSNSNSPWEMEVFLFPKMLMGELS